MVAAQNRLETTGAFTASLQLFLLLHQKTLCCTHRSRLCFKALSSCRLCSALLSSLARPRHVMRTTLLVSSLAQKRAGVGVGFRSVLMSAMTDLNLCTHKLPKNFLCRRLQAKLSDWQNVLQKIAESANIART